MYMTNLLLALMVQTRDIYAGKGEYKLFYVMLECWDDHATHPRFADSASKFTRIMERLFGHNTDKRGMGSWKDVKYILRYYKESSGLESC